jgi:hypothetical protein
MTYRAPLRDLVFTLVEVAEVERLAGAAAFPDFDRDTIDAVLAGSGGARRKCPGAAEPDRRPAGLRLRERTGHHARGLS